MKTTIEEKKAELLNIYLDSFDYSIIIEKVDELFGNPFFIFDNSFRLLSSSFKNIVNSKYLKKYDDSQILSINDLKEIIDNGDIESIRESNDVEIKKYSSIPSRLMFTRITNGKH